MIYCLVGENRFLRQLELQKLIGRAAPRRFDSSELSPNGLTEVLSGQSLFGGDECITIDDASNNKPLWESLGTWAEKLDADTTLILCDTKLDKRTKTYKQLQKHAKLITCDAWSLRQTSQAESWLTGYAKEQGISLNGMITRDMVQRAIRPSVIDEKPIIDQQLLATAVNQLSLAEEKIDQALIETILPPSVYENVFGLLEQAIRGDVEAVQHTVEHLAGSRQDGHQTFGLLASQAANLAALVVAQAPSAQVAADIGAHPYALAQLSELAGECSLGRIRFVLNSLAHADEQLKSGRGDAWVLIEKSLVEIALKK